MEEEEEEEDAEGNKKWTTTTTRRFSSVSKLYMGESFSAWGDRMWQYALGRYLVILCPSSLRLTATYGFIRSLSVISFGALVGKWIDGSPRLRAIRVSIGVQNLCVTIAGVLLCVFMESQYAVWMEYVFYALIIIVTCLADLASVASKINIEKDWTVVISGGDNEVLAEMNSKLRSIDLVTFTLAPGLVGVLFTYMSPTWAAVTMILWNLVSMSLEYHLLHLIYKECPRLAEKKASGCTEKHVCTSRCEMADVTYLAAWKSYFSHPVRCAGLGLASLYMTVLGFDSDTVGYAINQGLPDIVVGILTGVGALFGIGGSLVYPAMRRKMGIEKTTMLGFVMEISCLLICVASLWCPGSPFDPSHVQFTAFYNSCQDDKEANGIHTLPLNSENQSFWDKYTSISVLMTGIILSRFGLWIIDICITQIMQEKVEEMRRGSIGGVQNSLNMTLDLVKFLLLLVFSDTENFGIMILLSGTFVSFGWFLFTLYYSGACIPSATAPEFE